MRVHHPVLRHHFRPAEPAELEEGAVVFYAPSQVTPVLFVAEVMGLGTCEGTRRVWVGPDYARWKDGSFEGRNELFAAEDWRLLLPRGSGADTETARRLEGRDD